MDTYGIISYLIIIRHHYGLHSLFFDPLSDQIRTVAQSCLTLWDPMNHSIPGLPIHHQLQESTQTHFHRVSDAIQPSHPLSSPLSSCPQSLPASESFPMSQLLQIWWPKYWSFSLSIIPSKEHPGLISFRMDWLDILAVIIKVLKIQILT